MAAGSPSTAPPSLRSCARRARRCSVAWRKSSAWSIASSSGSSVAARPPPARPCSSARASSGPRSAPIAPRRASPSLTTRIGHGQHGARVGRQAAGVAPERAHRDGHRARAPTWPRCPGRRAAVARPARTWARYSPGVAAAGVSVKVRPMSTPAWSSEPPTPVPPWVSMYTAAGALSSGAREPLRDLPGREQAAPAAAGGGRSAGRRRRRTGAPARRRSPARGGSSATATTSSERSVRRANWSGSSAEAQDVHRLRLAAEPGGQLDRRERPRQVGDLQRAGDRVVVGDRHEVHAPAARQGVDLLGRGGALRQPQRPLDPELRELRGGRVDVQVGTARGGHRSRFACKRAAIRERFGKIV